MTNLPEIDKEEVRRLHAAQLGVDDIARQLGPGVGRKRIIETLEELGLSRFGVGQRSSETGKKRAVKINLATGLKLCSKCKEEKPASAFRGRQSTHDKLDTQCRDCRNAYGVIRRSTEQHRTGWLKWRLANLNRIMFLNARMRANARNLPFEISVEDIYVPDYCPNCECRLESNTNGKREQRKNSPSLDRYDPELGYVKENIWVICSECNVRKRDMTGEALMDFAAGLVENFKRHKKEEAA